MIDRFEGACAFLSNFYMHTFELCNVEMKSGEHAFQAMKCVDETECHNILDASTPGIAKKIGRSVFLRSDWEEVKDEVMLKVVRAKFTGDTMIFRQLQLTGTQMLVEGNRWHDNYWGDCYCAKCEGIDGQNVLGTIIMQVRSELMYAHPVIED